MFGCFKKKPVRENIFEKPERKVLRVFLHCSASDHDHHDNIDVIEEWHLARGFKGVGYHYFIQRNGNTQLGRDLEKTPAAQKGHNQNSIAICLHGLCISKFTELAFNELRALCNEINDAYDGDVSFHGHNEVNPHKTCPVYKYRLILNLDQKGRIQKEK